MSMALQEFGACFCYFQKQSLPLFLDLRSGDQLITWMIGGQTYQATSTIVGENPAFGAAESTFLNWKTSVNQLYATTLSI